MKSGAKATISELGVDDGVDLDEFGFSPRFDWIRDDCVAVMFVEYHEVISVATGGEREAASLVRGE